MKIIRRLPQNIEKKFIGNLDPILTRLFLSRGVDDVRNLIYTPKNLLKPNFLDIEKAAIRIVKAIEYGESIRVVGDYDADGATSTSLMIRFFNDIGYKKINYYIPKRSEGYGISSDIVTKAKNDGISVLITVDNGISAFDAALKAKELEIDLIITDHHLPSEVLPLAYAIVNPQRKDCPFESKCICGCGVAFYLVIEIRKILREHNFFKSNNLNEPNVAYYLDLVAIGTISDVVELDHNNRVMVQLGLERIRRGLTSKGILELIKKGKKNPSNLTINDIGFCISPKLNAAGRVEDMRFGVECLLANNEYDAKVNVSLLETFNEKRKQIEKEMYQEALSIISSQYGSNPKTGMVIYDENFHSGIVGILAGKLVNEFNVPIIVFSKNLSTGKLVGSARSIDSYHIKEALDRINAKHPLVAYGGHKQAAGLTIELANLEEFKIDFASDVNSIFNGNFPDKIFTTDGPLSRFYFSSSFIRTLIYDHPWGHLFPEPLFDGEFYVLKQYVVKDLHMRVLLSFPSGENVWAMYFFYDKTMWPNFRTRAAKVVYNFDISANSDDARYSLIIRGMTPLF